VRASRWGRGFDGQPPSPVSQPDRRLYYGWVLVVVLGITTTISYGTTAYLFGVLVVPVTEETGWSRATLSGAYALAQILAGLAGVPIGRLVDRHGARALMAVGSLLGGVSLIALSRVAEIWQFYVLWGGALGVATALTFYPVSFTVVANWFDRKRGSAMALLTTLGGLASPLFVPLAGWLVPLLGWRSTLVVLGLAHLAIALPLHALLLRRHPEDVGLRPDGQAAAPDRPPAPALGLTAEQALRQPAFWALTVSAALDQLAAMAVWAHQIAYVIGRGFDPVLAASLAGLIGLLSLPGRYVVNMVSDRFGAQRLLAICLTAQAVALAILLLGRSVAAIYVYALLFGLAFGTRSPLRASAMAEHFGRRAYGAITAAQGVPVAIASGLGPVAAGVLYDRLGDYQLAFGLTAAAFLLAGAIVFLTPKAAAP
jgi:sugar phosphate permease